MNLGWNKLGLQRNLSDGSCRTDPTADEPAENPAYTTNAGQADAADTQFGLVDVIEAFTAMRHEWRMQTRETRDLAQLIGDASARIDRCQAELQSRQDARGELVQNELVRQLVDAVIDIDVHLSRAIQAAITYEAISQNSAVGELRSTIDAWFGGLNQFTRWLCGRLHERLLSVLDDVDAKSQSHANHHRTHEGLELVLSRLRRLMHDQQIERVETMGKPFCAQTMQAIDVVDGNLQDCAQVVDQLSPAYYWQGRLIRYAEVRVAR